MLRRLVLAAVLTCLILPAQAAATLVFQKLTGDNFNQSSVWVAHNDGGNPRELIRRAGAPIITPDGSAVVYGSLRGRGITLNAIPVRGGESRVLLRRWDVPGAVISPDGRRVAALAKARRGRSRLVVIDRVGGARRVIARGVFRGYSFSPESDRLVYARAPRARRHLRLDLFVAHIAAGTRVAITDDGRSAAPVWGPERIVYSRSLSTKGEPAYELHTLSADGTHRRRLTHSDLPPGAQGAFGIEWSQAGDRLLAGSAGRRNFAPVALDPDSGVQRALVGPRRSIVPTALSRDGSTILGFKDPFEARRPGVVTIPYGGGKPTVIVRNAIAPDWNR